MDSIMRSGINAIILFPQAGPITEYEWIKSAQDRNLGVIVGGEMTHPRYLDGDFKNTTKKNYTEIFKELGIDEDITGYVRNFAPEEMYGLAAKMKVTDFVVPGNKPDYIKYYKNVIEMNGISKSILYSPGLIKQGGKISEGAKAAGKRFHGIVGRGIYEAENIRQAAIDLTSKL